MPFEESSHAFGLGFGCALLQDQQCVVFKISNVLYLMGESSCVPHSYPRD